jgi:hypothetical protein
MIVEVLILDGTDGARQHVIIREQETSHGGHFRLGHQVVAMHMTTEEFATIAIASRATCYSDMADDHMGNRVRFRPKRPP